MTGPRSFREAFTEDPADVKDRARIVGERDTARGIAVALEGQLAMMRETCREELVDHWTRCGKPAEFILWGKLFASRALGPRCYDHAAKHIGRSGMSRLDQWAVFDLRPAAALTGGGDDARP